MIAPNKIFSLEESALGRSRYILRQGPDACTVKELFIATGNNFESIDQFLLALDVLFVLGQIQLDSETKRVTYVG